MKSGLFKFVLSMIVCSLLSTINGISQKAILTPLPSNSSLKNDYAPFVSDSVLYFTSNRKNELIKTYYDQNNELLYRIYKLDILANDDWGKPEVFQHANKTKLNVGSIWIQEDKKEVYLTQNQFSDHRKSKGKENLLGIFSMDKDTKNWTEPLAFKYNSKRNFSTAHPTFTPDGNTMFFVSNEDIGYGESDIYQSDFVNGEWSEPINLGNEINTEGKEIFPFYHPSGKLYFSSNGRSENNDFDIFVSSYIDGKWTKPKALDYPINSNNNDFSCYISPSETEGYFATDRDGADNIYHFKIPFPHFPNAQEEVEDIFCYTLFENGPYQSDTLPYKYRWNFSDGESLLGFEVDHCFPGPGDYSVNLSVYDTLQNVDLFTVATYELPLDYTQQIKIDIPDTVIVNTKVTISAAGSVLKDFIPQEYYWILDENNKGKGETINHIFRTIGEYTIICGAPSLTDSRQKMATKKTIHVTE